MTKMTCCALQVGLVLIDEVHLLADNRGSTLEAVVTRLMMLSAADGMQDVSADPPPRLSLPYAAPLTLRNI